LEFALTEIASEPALLETKDLSKNFGGLHAVCELGFSINRGEIRGVIGPNGAGKTTLFNLISGHIKPSSGRVWFKQEDITELSLQSRARRGIARKFQITQIFKTLSVYDNVALAIFQNVDQSTAGLFKPKPVGSKVEDLLKKVRLEGKQDILASALSHGEQQLLELGMVLGTGAELLLLDEPTAGMSFEERAEMAKLIRHISESATIIITEHDFEFIKDVVDKVTVLNNGVKLAEGTIERIENNPAVRECYLGKEDA
jgi:branched-chain amino acid transport system ATP-binding protein